MDPTTLAILSTAAQALAGLGAVASAVIALCIAKADRKAAAIAAQKNADLQIEITQANAKHQLDLANTDRAFQLKFDRLQTERTALLKLAENLARGGSPDKVEAKRMGAEALVIIGMIGKEKLPLSWESRVQMDDDGIKRKSEEPGNPAWFQQAVEAKIALSTTVRELADMQTEFEPKKPGPSLKP